MPQLTVAGAIGPDCVLYVLCVFLLLFLFFVCIHATLRLPSLVMCLASSFSLHKLMSYSSYVQYKYKFDAIIIYYMNLFSITG